MGQPRIVRVRYRASGYRVGRCLVTRYLVTRYLVGRAMVNLAAWAFLFLLPLSCASQTAVKAQPEIPFSGDMKKYPGLLPELEHLAEALKSNVQLPPVRTQSQLLPALPPETTYYAAFPNYGATAHQAVETLRQELTTSAVLQDWWQHGELNASGPKLLDFLDKFYELSQYLGDEVVVTGETGGAREAGAAKREFLILAQVRKPGLDDFLKKILKEYPDESQLPVRILNPQELARAVASPRTSAAQQLVVLVRPDFVIGAQSIQSVRSFSDFLDAKASNFASTAFGGRLGETYRDGASVLLAADLHTIISQISSGSQQNQKMLERTGFKDAKFLVWDYKQEAQGSGSQMELSFMGPRHGIASWLAAPATLGSLDFVSPQAAFVSSVKLKNLGEIFDDIEALSADSNPNSAANLTRMEQAMHINLKDDLLSQFPGEITAEVSKFAEASAEWKVILRVSDADRVQQALGKILATMPFQAKQFEKDGIAYHSLTIPSAPKPNQIVYTFSRGYLIVASSAETAAEGIRLHGSGESLAKSKKLKESLPAGSPSEVSALIYEDPSAVTAMNLRRIAPEMAATYSRLAPPTAPIVFRAYGEESAIRGVSSGGAADPTVILVAAAVAIPNLLRARIAANESSAVATVRMVNVAEIGYLSSYPETGYATDLARLGPDPRGPSFHSSAHSSFIDGSLGNASCTSGAWCSKSGYNFTLTAECNPSGHRCNEFVIVGTPVNSSTGTRSFCSTSDGVVRYRFGAFMTSPIRPSECREWAAVAASGVQ